jgi:hypothetical protein
MQNKKPIGRRPKLDSEHLDFIDGEMEKNDELCAIGKKTYNSFYHFLFVKDTFLKYVSARGLIFHFSSQNTS